MKRIGYSLASLFTLALVASVASAATPIPNSAIVLTRLYDNCPISTVGSTNLYPGAIQITDTWDPLCIGFANGHVWNFSGDAGATSLDLTNGGSYRFASTVQITGNGTQEAGIHIAPWWNNMDGRFQARIPDGEIACFGGRLPFYSFTVNHGISYVAGQPIRMQITYLANGLSMASPASIQYECTYGGNTYTSPVLFFDEGNAAEDPPHGLWGSLNPSYAGGVTQMNNGSNGSNYVCNWADNTWECLDCVVPTTKASWGKVKSIYR